MRNTAWILLFLSLTVAAPCFAQNEVIPLNGAAIPVVTSAATDADAQEATADAAHSVSTLEMVRQAVSDSNLRPLKKRRMLRRLRRPAVASVVTDYVTSNAISEGVIDVGPPVFNADGSVEVPEMAIDFDALLDFIERLLPLILQLISLFG